MVRIKRTLLGAPCYITKDLCMKGVLVTFIFVLVPVVGYGTTYYVAKRGSDSTSCMEAQSISTPKLTIFAGLVCLAGGDTLTIKSGTYQEFIDYNQIPAGRGSWENATKIMSAPGERVILQPKTGGKVGDAVWIYRSYIIIDGLVIDASNVSVHAIRVNNGASYVRIINSEVKNAARGNCIGIQNARSNFVEIINSRIHDCGANNQHHGVYLRGSNHLVERNEIYNISGHGVHLWNKHDPTNNNNIVRYNYVHDNGSRGILIGSGYGNQAYGNIVSNNRMSGIVIGYNSPTNSSVYENTIYLNRRDCIVIQRGSTNSRINNNICWQNGSDTVNDLGSLSIVRNTRVTNPFPDARGTGSREFLK
jgi:parallel beta-helix repeat protein